MTKIGEAEQKEREGKREREKVKEKREMEREKEKGKGNERRKKKEKINKREKKAGIEKGKENKKKKTQTLYASFSVLGDVYGYVHIAEIALLISVMPVKSYQPLIHPRWLPSGSFHQPFARPTLFFPPTGRKHPRNDLNLKPRGEFPPSERSAGRNWWRGVKTELKNI